jgi:hypothetical protein
MWDSMPWIVRLAIEIMAAVIVIGVALSCLFGLLWLFVAIREGLTKAAWRREERRRRALGYRD